MESPCPVQYIIGSGCNRKTYGICGILLYFHHLLEKVGDTEINKYTGKTYNAELNKL
jgi:hypothetical protein